MSRRCGSSRTLGPTRQCAIYVRGGLCCAWCLVALSSPSEASIDHLDANPRNNATHNLVPSCRWCNRERACHWVAGAAWWPHTALTLDMVRFDAYLVRRGTSLMAAVVRIEAQRWLLLPLAEGKALAAQWHAARLESDRARAKRRQPAVKAQRAERLAIQGAHAGVEVIFP